MTVILTIRVYDVQRKLFIDESFHTLEQHWAAMLKRYEVERSRSSKR
jgi:hypothetical protein